jgi:hypothetical protein
MDLRQATSISPTNKADRNDITEILLKVAIHKLTNLIVYKFSNVNYKNFTTSLIFVCLG